MIKKAIFLSFLFFNLNAEQHFIYLDSMSYFESKEILDKDKDATFFCAFSAGTFQINNNDSIFFNSKNIGFTVKGNKEEHWLNINNKNVKNIMISKIETAIDNECDGLLIYNTDVYNKNSNFNIDIYQNQEYILDLINYARKKELKIAMLKNEILEKNFSEYFKPDIVLENKPNMRSGFFDYWIF